MSSTMGKFALVPVNSISNTSEMLWQDVVKKVPSMSKGNDILHKLCYYLEVSPSLLDIVSNDVFLIGPCMLPFKTA